MVILLYDSLKGEIVVFKKILKFKKIIIILVTIFLIVSCGESAQSSQTISSSNFSYSFSSRPSTYSEESFSEKFFEEDKKKEAEKYEKRLDEELIFESLISELINREFINNEILLEENVILEDINITFFESYDEFEAYDSNYSIYDFGFDIEFAKQNFDDNLKLVMIELTIGIGSLLLSVVLQQWNDALLEAGTVLLTAAGAALGAYIISEKYENISRSVGNSADVVQYERILGASEGLLWGSLAALPLTLIQLSIATRQIINLVKNWVLSLKVVEILESGKTIGYLKGKNIYKTASTKSDEIIGSLDDFKNLSLNDGRYIGRLSKIDLDKTTINIEDIIKDSPTDGNAFKDYFDSKGKPNFRVTDNNDGTYNRTNFINDKDQPVRLSSRSKKMTADGWELDAAGNPLKRFDVVSQKHLADFSAANKAGLIVNRSGEISNRRVYDLKTNRHVYLDESGKIIAFEEANFIKAESNIPNDRIALGEFNVADGKSYITPDWVLNKNSLRKIGTDAYRARLIDIIINRPELDAFWTTPVNGIPRFTVDELIYIRTFKRLPPGGFQIHHVKGVKNFPELAANFANMEPVRVRAPYGATIEQQKIMLRNSKLDSFKHHKILGHSGNYKNLAQPTPTYFDITKIGG